MLFSDVLFGGVWQAADAPMAQSVAKLLAMIDFSERQLDGAAALVLTFNTLLDSKQDFAAQIHITDDKSGNVDGGWRAQNDKARHFRHPELSRKLTVTIDAGLKIPDGSRLAEVFTQTITTCDIQPHPSWIAAAAAFDPGLAGAGAQC